jgi:hypothetical protein
MRDLDKALSDISAIRNQIAAGTAFRGYGPAALAASGGLAFLTALGLSLWLDDPTGQHLLFLGLWAGAAALSIGLIWLEMRRRAHRHHSGLADEMIRQAMEQFLPAAAAGVLLPLFTVSYAPEIVWTVPGFWQVLMGLGLFASARSLPRRVTIVAAGYLIAGFAVLLLASETRTLSPWTMGVPFIVGQLAMAAIIHLSGKSHAED